MWSFMESQRPSVFTATNFEGVERVKKGRGSYAYLMESTSIEYTIERNCDLTQIGGMLDSKGKCTYTYNTDEVMITILHNK